MRGVFDISGASVYDDKITERYHFPSKYLPIAERVVGDWVVYRETRVNNGRMAYVSAAFLEQIERDKADPTHFYARVSKYFEFDGPVPYRSSDGIFLERFLRDLPKAGDAGRMLRGASVRILEEADFSTIIRRGLHDTLDPRNPFIEEMVVGTSSPVELFSADRKSEAVLVNRLVRLASFRLHVLSAYDATCAVTGLKVLDQKGKPEAQAAHILPVASGGPDTVRNGIALTSTVHWLFDRHLFTIDENYRVVVGKADLPSQLVSLLQPGRCIRLPANPNNHPSQDYLSLHRSQFYKRFQ
ncbi:HNH endonuclease [Agrobacterium sp. CFBP2214]|jgi:putative restriction endonuclease|uniref:HNH endonuclease n=1 Tax=Agrobacterium sp. CFBP2214 TaxID=3040274 RepID=UPI00101A8594|nr:HNH endonuclease [Agrobacterium sp. CFBP2214]